MPNAKPESSNGTGPPVCKRGVGVWFNPIHLKELRGDLQYRPRPVETLEDITHAARHFMGVWRPLILSVAKVAESLQMCYGEGCAYLKLLLPPDLPMEEQQLLLLIETLTDEQKRRQDLRAFTDKQRCPLCLRFVTSIVRIGHIEKENGRLVQVAARLLPDAFEKLEVIHLVDGCSHGIADCAAFILEDRINAAERDWNRLLKAATLARERGRTSDDGSPFFAPRHSGRPLDDSLSVTLKEFMKRDCVAMAEPLLKSRLEALSSLHRRKRLQLPKHVEPWKPGQSKYYPPAALLQGWPSYRHVLPALPPLKSEVASAPPGESTP